MQPEKQASEALGIVGGIVGGFGGEKIGGWFSGWFSDDDEEEEKEEKKKIRQQETKKPPVTQKLALPVIPKEKPPVNKTVNQHISISIEPSPQHNEEEIAAAVIAKLKTNQELALHD